MGQAQYFAFEAGLRGRHTRKVKGLMSGTLGSPFGRRRMCDAQTAAPEVKRQKRR